MHACNEFVWYYCLARFSFYLRLDNIILPEVTAQYETVEGLQELSLKPPYNIDCSWSNEASLLREIAVNTPHKLSHDFVLNYFKSLRIIDKKVKHTFSISYYKFENNKYFL